MHVRRALAALSVLAVLLTSIPGGGAVARAQTDVERADQQARDAEQGVDSAYQVVDEAVTNRDAVEAELFATLDAYTVAGDALVEATDDLDRIGRSLAFAEASAAEVQRSLEVQAVTAYMEAVSATPSVVLDAGSVESALVVDEVFRVGRRDTLSQLDDLVVRRQELDTLRTGYAQEQAVVESRRTDLDAQASHLQELFAQANAEVAVAFAQAQAAESTLASALDELEAAQAREEARRREEAARQAAAATTTTTAPTTTSTTATTTTTTAPTTTTTTPTTTGTDPGSTTTTTVPATTTTTTTTSEGPSIPISSSVLAWLPLLEQHFAPDLVEDSLVIMQCESLGDPEAYNPSSGAAGLFQFLAGTWAVASVSAGVGDRSVFDGEANIIAASWLAEYYRSRGYDPWRPWSCRKYL